MTHRKLTMLILLIAVPLLLAMAIHLTLNTSQLNVSAVQTQGLLGVYWDRACTRPVYSISWGIIATGSTKEVTIYVRNESNETCIFIEIPANWNPYNASNFLEFTWSCGNNKIEAGKNVSVKQKLQVAPNTVGIQDFSFDIIFNRAKYFPWDVTQDGQINMLDLIVAAKAYSSSPESPNWNPRADVNADSRVNMVDYYLVSKHYGENYS